MSLIDLYPRADITPFRGEGAWLYDETGQKWLDFMSGVASCNLGHAHPKLVEALQSQAEKLWHVSNFFQIPGQEKLADWLVRHSFADKAFFCNSGLEAMEALIKLARRYHFAAGQPERTRIITFENAFHGRSLLTLSAAGNPAHLEGVGPAAEGFDIIEMNIARLEKTVTPETAAILLEPIQGDGGIRVCPKTFLKEARALCDREGILLLLDEIQCGMGRTGTLWAHEAPDINPDGIKPDAMALAKGLGGGFPVGAVLATEKAAEGMVRGIHGTTFGGNPLAMAVAMAVVTIIGEKDFLAHVRKMAGICLKRLEEIAKTHPAVIAEIRGLGLMLGIQTIPPNVDVITKLREAGVLTAPAADNIIRLLPPLVIEESHIDIMANALEKTVSSFE